MSAEAIKWAYRCTTDNIIDKFVLVTLADLANDRGKLKVEQSTLAARAMCSVATIQRALRRLEARGLLARQHQRGLNGLRTVSVYVLRFRRRPSVKLMELCPLPDDQPKETGLCSPTIHHLGDGTQLRPITADGTIKNTSTGEVVATKVCLPRDEFADGHGPARRTSDGEAE